jgi:hypothetical protein
MAPRGTHVNAEIIAGNACVDDGQGKSEKKARGGAPTQEEKRLRVQRMR